MKQLSFSALMIAVMVTILAGAVQTSAGVFLEVYNTNFDGGIDARWSSSNSASNPNVGNYRGNFSTTGNTTLTLSGLPPHTQLSLEFDLYLFYTWDGEDATWGKDYFSLSGDVNGAWTFSTTYYYPPYQNEYDAQSYPGSPNEIYGFDVWNPNSVWVYRGLDPTGSGDKFLISHSRDIFSVTFGGPTTQSDEWWGIDNVRVSILTLEPTNAPPVANANGPYVGNEGFPITFDASGSTDPDGDTLEFRWDFDGDGVWDTPWSFSPTAQNTWIDDYTGKVELEVTDGKLYARDRASVTVLNVSPEVKPRVVQARYEAESFFDVFFDFTDAGQKDTHNAVLDWGDGQTGPGVVNETNGQGAVSGGHTYADNSVYIIVVIVTDDDGGVGKSSLQIVVNNVPPKVEAGPDQTVTAGDLVVLGGSFTDPGWLDIHTASYDFGDSASGAGVVVEENMPPDSTGTVSGGHTYFAAGEYTVTLTVADKDGGTGKDTLKVVVKAIAATSVKFTPQAVNKNDRNGDPWVMVKGSLPAPYVVKNIDPSTVKLNGTVPAVTDPKYDFTQTAADGAVTFMFKFDRLAVEATLSLGDAVVVTITGKVSYSNGTDTGLADFQGQDIIKVLESKKAAPALAQEFVFAAPPAYPQPCNPEVWIPFSLPTEAQVTIRIYSSFGGVVRTLELGSKQPGAHINRDKAARWDGKNELGEDVSSGVYFYTIQAGDFTATRKLLIVR